MVPVFLSTILPMLSLIAMYLIGTFMDAAGYDPALTGIVAVGVPFTVAGVIAGFVVNSEL